MLGWFLSDRAANYCIRRLTSPGSIGDKQYIKQERISTGADGLKTAFADRMITEKASKRIGRMAFDIAVKRGQTRAEKTARGEEVIWKRNPRVTIVHKSNVLSVTDGLFRESVHAVKAEEPRFKGVDVDEQLVDSMV